MSKKTKNTPAKRSKTNPASSQNHIVQEQIHVQEQLIETNIFPPDVLRQFDNLVPGTAKQLIEDAREETKRRRDREEKVLEANIKAQEKNFSLIKNRDKAVARSGYLGQAAGFLVCLTCIGSALYLGIKSPEYWEIPVALAAIPTAATIQAFRLNPFSKKKGSRKE